MKIFNTLFECYLFDLFNDIELTIIRKLIAFHLKVKILSNNSLVKETHT